MEGLAAFFQGRPEIEVVIFAGKGGLGKTTNSAALSLSMAEQGRRTLCFSTDPQASLSDVFERDIFGRGVVELRSNLQVIEIDADQRVRDYQNQVKQKIRSMYGREEIPREIEEYIDSTSAEPAMYESATYDAMAELVEQRHFQFYVFDMPPFGHGVRMIAMADILARWVEKITETREQVAEYEAVAASLKGGAQQEDTVLAELLDIRRRIKTFTDLLTDRRRTAFFMVLVPERMAILDTERALEMFAKLGLEMSGLVVNQIYPRELLARPGISDLIKSRIEMQQQHLEEIARKFGSAVLAAVPMYSQEPKGFEMLKQVAADQNRPRDAFG
ncbi:MAG: ArsA family ATPase [Terriglobia bacterium]